MAEHPETKQYVAGATAKHNGECASLESRLAPSFVVETAAKTNKSEAVISNEIQIATNIPERVQAVIKDLPVADNKSELLKLSRFNETAQNVHCCGHF